MMKSKIKKFEVSRITLLVALFGIPLIIFFWKSMPQNLKYEQLPKSTLVPEATIFTPIEPTPDGKPLSTTKTFPHELLPGFNIAIPSSWVVHFKQFGEKDSLGLAPEHPFPYNLSEMFVQIWKPQAHINLIFTPTQGYDATECDNNWEYVDLGNKLFRVKDKNNYFYTKYLRFGSLLYKSVGINYKVCTEGPGIGLIESSPIAKDGDFIIVEAKIVGSPDQQLLNEMDAIIRSITGLKTNL